MKDEPTSTAVAEPPDEKEKSATAVAEKARATSPNGHQPPAETTPAARPGPPKTIWREYFESAVVTVIMALFGMTFIVQAVKVPTGSMQNTIEIGDHLLVNKFIFAPGPTLPFPLQREIKRGDIIVFKYPGNQYNAARDRDPNNIPFKTNYVKRVIGLPGDRIEVRGDHVYVNGQELPEHRVTARNIPDDPYTSEHEENAPVEVLNNPPPSGDGGYTVFWSPESRNPKGAEDNSTFHFAVNGKAAIVPSDSYFVMGDNRDNSADSREWGFVRRDLIIGRAMFIYWSYDESAPSSTSFFGPLADFFQNTRWNRTGTMVK